MDRYSINARRLAIWFTLITTFAVFALLPFSKISFAPTDLKGLGYLFAVSLVFSIYCWKRKMLRLAPALEAVALGIFLTVPILISTYLAASLDLPLMDHQLMWADGALGFDWIAFIRFVDARPALAHILAWSYSSFAIQLLVIPLILGATGRYGRSYAMIGSYGVLCYISAVVSIWFPATSAYTAYGVAQEQLQHINAMYGFHFLHDFTAVRENAEFNLSVANASGIVTFPSCHAGGALLCAWAAWDLKPARYVFAAWNLLMAISAVSHGSHYLVDVFAGIAVAAVSIFVVTEALRIIERAEWSVPSPSAIPAAFFRGKREANQSASIG